LKKGKWWQQPQLKLRIAKIKSNVQAGKYAGSISSDHSHVQGLVEPLLIPGIV